MLTITADLTFTAAAYPVTAHPAKPGAAAAAAARRQVKGRVRGSGSVLRVEFDQLPRLLSRSGRGLARTIADRLDELGLTVQLVGPGDQLLVEIGHRVRGPGWLGLLTATRALRVRSWPALLRTITAPPVLTASLPRAH